MRVKRRCPLFAIFGGAVLCSALKVDAQMSPRSMQTAAASTGTVSSTSTLSAHAGAEFSAYSDSDAVTVFTPSIDASLGDAARKWQVDGHYLIDIVSAASVDIVSSASPRWTEVRHAGALAARHQFRELGASVSAAASSEPDYESLTAGARVSLELAQKTINPALAYSFGHDVAGRTGTPFSVYAQPLSRHTLSAAVELVLSRTTTFTITADGVLERGDQKKPYRMLPMFAPDVAARVPVGASFALVNQLRLPGRMTERTPLERRRFALSGHLATRFAGSTLSLDERLYGDDWGLLASTTDARFVADIGRRLFVWLHGRSHVQTGVSFWERAYIASFSSASPSSVPEYRTGDRELSPFVSLTAGPGARLRLGRMSALETWALTIQTDLTYTDYRDAIYVRNRLAALASLACEAEF